MGKIIAEGKGDVLRGERVVVVEVPKEWDMRELDKAYFHDQKEQP